MTENTRLNSQRELFEKFSAKTRDRLYSLFDENTFVETDAFKTEDISLPSDGLICGYGTIFGKLTFAYAQDVSVLGGSFGKIHGEKIKSLYKKACRLGTPIIGILDSKGVRLNEGIAGFTKLGEIYNEMAKASGVIPQITLVCGNAMGSLSLLPAMSDFCFSLKNSNIFMTSPAAKGKEKEKPESLSFVDKTFDKEEDMFGFARILVNVLPSCNAEDNTSFVTSGALYNAELNENQYETSDIIKIISDNNDFIKTFEAEDVLLGFSRFGGQLGAIVGFTGKDASSLALNKIADFVSFADAFRIPVVAFSNLSGYSKLDTESEIIKAAAKVTQVFSNATVPKINIITEKFMGSPLLSINSKNTEADLVYVWSNSQIGLMSADASVNVMSAEEFKNADNLEEMKEAKLNEYKKAKLDSFEFARLGLADDVIEPAETKSAIVSAAVFLSVSTTTKRMITISPINT